VGMFLRELKTNNAKMRNYKAGVGALGAMICDVWGVLLV